MLLFIIGLRRSTFFKTIQQNQIHLDRKKLGIIFKELSHSLQEQLHSVIVEMEKRSKEKKGVQNLWDNFKKLKNYIPDFLNCYA